jgi:hypothetical protein
MTRTDPHSRNPSEVSRLEVVTARDLPPGTRLTAEEEATRVAFLAWGAELQQQAEALDHQALAEAVKARLDAELSTVPSGPAVSRSARQTQARRVPSARGRAIAWAMGGVGVALGLLLALFLRTLQVPPATVPYEGHRVAEPAPAMSGRAVGASADRAQPASPSAASRQGAVASRAASEEGRSAQEPAVLSVDDRVAWPSRTGGSAESAESPQWEDPLDAELWWTRQVLVYWSRPPARVDGRLAWMGDWLEQLQQDLIGDSL